jgi:hypothetical protein
MIMINRKAHLSTATCLGLLASAYRADTTLGPLYLPKGLHADAEVGFDVPLSCLLAGACPADVVISDSSQGVS